MVAPDDPHALHSHYVAQIKKSYLDPVQGLLHVQGSMTVHLSMFLVMFQFYSPVKHEHDQNPECDENQLFSIINKIQVMHICSFFSKYLYFNGKDLVPAKYKDIFDPAEMISIMYYFGIFFVMIEYMHSQNSKECKNDHANLYYWIIFEI